MAFEKTPGGTRGTSMPSFVTPVMKLVNNQMIKRFRRPGASGGKAAGMDGLVLTTVGAKTGKRRQTLLGTFPDGYDNWLIVVFGGRARPRIRPGISTSRLTPTRSKLRSAASRLTLRPPS